MESLTRRFDILEAALSDAVSHAVSSGEDADWVLLVAQELARQCGYERVPPPQSLPPPPSLDQVIERATARSACESDAEDDEETTAWSATGWASGLNVGAALAHAMLLPLPAGASARTQLNFLRLVGEADDGHQTTRRLLEAGIDALSNDVWKGVQALASARAATAKELTSKFVAEDGAFSLAFGGLHDFYLGLEGLVGSPSPNVYDEMEREHVLSTDSCAWFITSNYGVHTTSRVEWTFVTQPENGLQILELDEWPAENRQGEGVLPVKQHRVPRSLESLDGERLRIDAELQVYEVPPLSTAEFVGARIYTGPMYHKCTATRDSNPRESKGNLAVAERRT